MQPVWQIFPMNSTLTENDSEEDAFTVCELDDTEGVNTVKLPKITF